MRYKLMLLTHYFIRVYADPKLTQEPKEAWMLVAYLRGAYFAVLIYLSDVGDGYGRVDFVKVAKINPVWLVVT